MVVKKYTLELTEPEMGFFRELMQSQLPVAISAVEVVASVKLKVMTTVATESDE